MDVGYWTRASIALARSLRDREFRRAWLEAGLMVTPQAPEVSIFDLVPGAEDFVIPMGDVRFRRSNMDPAEQWCIRALAMHLQPRRVFEIGTFDGSTTLALAQAAPAAEVFTLDLAPSHMAIADMHDEVTLVAAGEVGARFAGTSEAARITQLYGDSRTFDFAPYFGTVDLVLIDAGHSYEFAKSDTNTALQLVRPGGVILWDDYVPGWPGVVRAVDETGLSVVRLAYTGMAALLA